MVIVGDRTSVTREKRVVWADFLGAPAPFPLGPFALASVLACPCLSDVRPQEQGRFRVHFEPFAERLLLPRAERGSGPAPLGTGLCRPLAAPLPARAAGLVQFLRFLQLTHDEQ